MINYLRTFFLTLAFISLTACTSINGNNDNIAQLSTQGVQVVQQGVKVNLILPADTFFKSGSPTLKPSAYPILDNIAVVLSQYLSANVTIAGYTDNVSSPKRNREFSKALANSIVTYLWTKGIPFQRMTMIGYGEANPIATNRTVQGNTSNRRVEINFWQQAV
jgi:outer membrane protein OmpA-like peptidoglycan-associated protein